MHGFDTAPHNGLTHVIDKGLGPRAWEDVLETCGDYITLVKLGWGTAYVTPNLERKLEVLKGKPVVIGGTFLEAVISQGKVDEYKRWLAELGLTYVEISVEDLIFEAPTKGSQAWFVREFGPSVNLGNIPPEEVISLETLRLGLRADTLKEVLPGGDRAAT